MALYADFSAGRPGAAALRAAGFTGVIRYVGIGSAGKRITASEYQDYVANQLDVFLVVESGTQDAWAAGVNSRTAGRSNAQAALDDCHALGIPDGVPIAAAADSHASGSQIADAVAYCQGFADVLGVARTGFYGFSETVAAIRAAGVAHWFWLCGSQPSVADQAWVNFWQDNTRTTTVNGIACDINHTYAPIGVVPEVELNTTWTDTYGNVQSVESFYNDVQRKVNEAHDFVQVIHDALLTQVPSRVPGSTTKLSPLDAALNADASGFVNEQTLTKVASAVAAIPTAVPTFTLDQASLDAIKASVVAAVGAVSVTVSDADKTAIANATADELAKRLVA